MIQHSKKASDCCPECGEELSPANDLLLCSTHGAFVHYGPQLIVRAPKPAEDPDEVTLPWEPNHKLPQRHRR
jgi:hypothetical protein